MGNRTASLAASPWSYNSSNRLTAIGSGPDVTFTYDNNGNTNAKTDSTGTTSYTWDYENRLASVTLPNSGGTVSFTYDPLGRRVRKQYASATTVYAYDGENIVEETDASGTAVARYAMGLSIDEPLAMLRSSATHYYSADGLGSVTTLTDGSGAVAASYTYDTFGNLAASSGTVVNPFRYTAREWDGEAELYFYRARYYSQVIGRFASEDPKRFLAGMVFYQYADGNPVNFVDPFGLDTKVCFYADAAFGYGHVGFGLPQKSETGTMGYYKPGIKKDEQKKSECIIIKSTPEQDDCMLQCRSRREKEPGEYRLFSRQCTSFVRDCLKECGLPTGPYSGSRPRPFYRRLSNAVNPPEPVDPRVLEYFAIHGHLPGHPTVRARDRW